MPYCAQQVLNSRRTQLTVVPSCTASELGNNLGQNYSDPVLDAICAGRAWLHLIRVGRDTWTIHCIRALFPVSWSQHSSKEKGIYTPHAQTPSFSLLDTLQIGWGMKYLQKKKKSGLWKWGWMGVEERQTCSSKHPKKTGNCKQDSVHIKSFCLRHSDKPSLGVSLFTAQTPSCLGPLRGAENMVQSWPRTLQPDIT